MKILLLYEFDKEAKLLLFEDPFVETEFIESFVDIVCFNGLFENLFYIFSCWISIFMALSSSLF